MIVKINKKLWTNFNWWHQLLINKNQIIVRNLDSDEKVEFQLVIAENKNEEELKQLLEYLHGATLNGEASFNVESWTSRIKNGKIGQEK